MQLNPNRLSTPIQCNLLSIIRKQLDNLVFKTFRQELHKTDAQIGDTRWELEHSHKTTT